MSRRALSVLGPAVLALLTGWAALWSWGALIEQPVDFLRPTLLGGALMMLTGVAARLGRLRWYGALPLQVLVGLLYLNAFVAPSQSLARVVPTRASVLEVVQILDQGAYDLYTYLTPIAAERVEAYPYLVATSMALLLAVDLVACGWRRVPLAGLPVLLTLTIPVSILDTGLSWLTFTVTALFFLGLLSTEEMGRVRGWGRSVSDRPRTWDSLDQVVTGASVRTAALRIGAVTTAAALALPLAVPVAQDVFGLRSGQGNGRGGGNGVSIVNPMVDLRRDLRQSDESPLVFLDTPDPDPSYLRLTVLDAYNGDDWRPSPRDLPQENRVDGPLPRAPGLPNTRRTRELPSELTIASGFRTRWLPTPYPASEINVPRGDWRYDSRTLDVVDAGNGTVASGLRYRVVAQQPRFSAQDLAGAVSAPGAVSGPMTRLPQNLPAVITERARQVTADARTDFARAVAIQDWFHDSGGFTYSTEPLPGSGMAQLARFITDDKVGYCEQYATAMAVMARTLGLPARVAVGFLRPQKLAENRWVYTSKNLHAWPEIYFTGVGWVRFEPTPASHTGDTPGYTRQELAAPQLSPTAPTAAPTQRRRTEQQPSTPASSAGADSGGTSPWLPAVLAVLLLVLLVATPRLIRDARRRRRLFVDPDAVPPDAATLTASAWEELRATARDLGIAWPAGRTVRETGRWLVNRVDPDDGSVTALEDLVALVERAHYGRPGPLTEVELRRVHEAVECWRAVLARYAGPRARRRAAVLPRSVFSRRPARVRVPEGSVGLVDEVAERV